MVRLIPVVRKGRTEWVEDAPAVCAEGHEQLVPTWSACPDCGDMVRLWQCRVDGCEAPLIVDDEHVHHSGTHL